MAIYSEKKIERTFKFEGEVISQMSAFMVATEEEEGIGIPDFQGPKVKNTL